MLYLTPLERAFERLKKGWVRHLAQPDDKHLRGGLIQRFEFTDELSHKTLKRFLEANSASPEERAIVLRILNEIVPDREVWAFDSRVTGKAKPFSDLDLAIMGDEPLPLEKRAQLENAFSESELPWKVDVMDWNLADENFRNLINRNKSYVSRKANQ